jgi:Icc-related predicted phosphoesterase
VELQEAERSVAEQPVRILVVSDHVVSTLFNQRVEEFVGHIDLLLSCGDLPYSYLEYLVTQLEGRYAYFVHGNHDSPEYCANGRTLTAPGGWVNLDRRAVYVESLDLLLAGLEGSIRYKPDAPYQYTQLQMKMRARRLMARLALNRLFRGRALDIFIAHSPPAGIHDGPDGPHRGFSFFLTLMDWFRPRLLLHGHKHRYGPMPWRTQYASTEVVNVYPYRVIEWYPDHVKYAPVYHH